VREKVPDLAFCKLSNEQQAGLSSPPFCFPTQELTEDSVYFFFDYPDEAGSASKWEIKYVTYSKESPFRFHCCDAGQVPKPGCSGSPLFEAKVVVGKQTERQFVFRFVAVVYARTRKKDSEVYQGCCVPIDSDLWAIFNILIDDDVIRMANLLASTASAMGGSGHDECQSNQLALHDRNARLDMYVEGITDLNMDLAEDEERLYYNGLVPIERSLLLKKVKKTWVGRPTINLSLSFMSCKTS